MAFREGDLVEYLPGVFSTEWRQAKISWVNRDRWGSIISYNVEEGGRDYTSIDANSVRRRGFAPPAGGGFAPPAGGGFAPPIGGGFAPPAGGGFAPPIGGGFAPPTQPLPKYRENDHVEFRTDRFSSWRLGRISWVNVDRWGGVLSYNVETGGRDYTSIDVDNVRASSPPPPTPKYRAGEIVEFRFRGGGREEWHQARVSDAQPGSPCLYRLQDLDRGDHRSGVPETDLRRPLPAESPRTQAVQATGRTMSDGSRYVLANAPGSKVAIALILLGLSEAERKGHLIRSQRYALKDSLMDGNMFTPRGTGGLSEKAKVYARMGFDIAPESLRAQARVLGLA